MASPGGARRRSGEDELGDLAEDQASLVLSRTKSTEITVTESGALSQPALTETGLHREDSAVQSMTLKNHSIKYKILLCAFLTSMSFGVTQVPLLYVFKLMTCDAYYKTHPAPVQVIFPYFWMKLAEAPFGLNTFIPDLHQLSNREDDRCSIRAIESSVALSVSLLGASTTIFGIFNLFVTGSLIKRIGVQRALIIQVFFPAARLLIQNIGVEVWGYKGILIVQCSQIASIIGGPSGYVLALNQFITEAVTFEARTAALGRLAGTMLFGSAFGFLLGGLLAEEFGIKTPFRVTLVLFLCSTAFVAIFLPYVAPAQAPDDQNVSTEGCTTNDRGQKHEKKSRSKFFGPLLVFTPQKFVLRDGSVQTEYGACLLACGVFLGILATGYLPTLLQLYSTNVFQFGNEQNGWLIFMYSSLRGVFLTFAFPSIIAIGRKYVMEQEKFSLAEGIDSTTTDDIHESQPLLTEGTRTRDPESDVSESDKGQVYTFDLTYTRFSIVADGILTLLCSFLRQGWQMYLMAAILPFAAGTGSAAKGTVLQIVGATASSHERTDALAGISLVENMARMTTTFAFGIVFAGFTNLGRPELVFTTNASCALIAFIVLLFARFPPKGSRRLE